MSGGGDNVGVGEGRGNDARRHQATDVGHVRHQQRSATVGDLPEPGVVEVARVAADSGDDQLRFEQQGVPRQLVIVDQPSLGVHLVVWWTERQGSLEPNVKIFKLLDAELYRLIKIKVR